jgi:uncharacterized protein YjiK
MADDEAQEYMRQIHEKRPDYRDIKTACKKVKSAVASKMEAYNRLLVKDFSSFKFQDRKKAMIYERDRRSEELQDLTKELEVQSTVLSKAQPVLKDNLIGKTIEQG